jgi:hypothetical protein
MARARQLRAGSHQRLLADPDLRSTLHPMLRLFAAGTLRAEQGLRAGESKAQLRADGSKLVLLDEAYVSFNQVMRSVIRIDLDQTFASWDALREAIQETGMAPPNLAVAQVDDEGRVVHPHGYWLLAQAVCCTKQGRGMPQRLLRALGRGIVRKLETCGADPGGLHNPFTGKNPLSPLWSCQVMTAVPFNLTNGSGAQPGLPALADYVRPISGRAETSPPDDESDVAQSNGLFKVLKSFCLARVGAFHPQGRGEGSFEDFRRVTIDYALSLPTRGINDRTVENSADRQAEFAWKIFKPNPALPHRGRYRAACQGKPLPAKQRIAALAVAAAKRQQSLERLLAAYWALTDTAVEPAGSMPLNRAWAEKAGVEIRTLQKHKKALRAMIARNERSWPDKREPTSPQDTDESFFITLRPVQPAQTPDNPVDNAETEHSGHAPLSFPPQANLTIAASARPPRLPAAPKPLPPPPMAPDLIGRILFPGESSLPASQSAVAVSPAALIAAGFEPFTGTFTPLPAQPNPAAPAPHWPILANPSPADSAALSAAADASICPPSQPNLAPPDNLADPADPTVSNAASAKPPDLRFAGPTPRTRKQREYAPGFLEEQSRRVQLQRKSSWSTSSAERRILPEGTDQTGKPKPSGG